MESSKNEGIIYCRVSSSEQVDNTSLETQQRICSEYAAKHGIKVPIENIFIEEGVSAKTVNRAEFQKAIALCCSKKNKIGYFIVYKVDRFARNQDDHAIVRANLKRYGTVLRSATEPIDDTPTGRLMETMVAGFAEFDNSTRRERCRGGMYENLKQGIWQWEAPLGYYRPYKGSNIAPKPSLSPYIKMMFEEWSKGTYTYKSLAEYLNNRGLKTKKGKGITMQTLEKTMKNPLYCGVIRIWDLDLKGNFEPIISEDLFARCQKGYKRKYTYKNRTRENILFPLKKISICSECKTSLTGSSTSKGRKDVLYSYYHHHKQDCPKAKAVPKKAFEQMFLAYLSEITPNEKYEKIFKAIVMDIWHSNYKNLNENNVRVRNELDKMEGDRIKVFELHRAGKYTDSEFLEQKDILNKKIGEKQKLLQENYIAEFNMEEALDYCFRFVKQTSENWVRFRDGNYQHLIRFQNQIFPSKIDFDGKKFGTNELSLVYKINQESGQDLSHVVDPSGIEPLTSGVQNRRSTI